MNKDDERTGEFKFNWVFNDITQKKEKIAKQQKTVRRLGYIFIQFCCLMAVTIAMVYYRRFNTIVMCMAPIKEEDVGKWTDAAGQVHTKEDDHAHKEDGTYDKY